MCELSQSILFGLSNKKRLAKLLKISLHELLNLNRNLIKNKAGYYKIFANKQKRMIQTPIQILVKILRRINYHLNKIDTPAYVCSTKGKSYIQNARNHKNSEYILKMDIKSFFKNCKEKAIKRFFIDKLKMSGDIARILTNFTTFEGYLPTGSPTSSILSFWSNYERFSRIMEISNKLKLKFTLYVDDLTFSCDSQIPSELIKNIRYELKKVKLKLSNRKIVNYASRTTKVITGVAINNDKNIEPTNKLKKKIFAESKGRIKISRLNDNQIKAMLGRVNAARQIDPNIYPGLYRQLITHLKQKNGATKLSAVR